ncbi:UNVERIFIED_CONTAM: hypothetical protein Sangu_0834300 [Sesamum angustifolium]|uniref:Uncharacterized protein n=1 Tax=Sesamum angustifolium TaxID=2727405 RepID=A0AAW2PWJ2_9LAMI
MFGLPIHGPMKSLFKELLMFVSGDHDLVAPHISTEKWIESLEVPIKSDWRPWFVEGQIGGLVLSLLASYN